MSLCSAVLIIAKARQAVPNLAGGCAITFPVSDFVYLAPTAGNSGKRLYLWPGLNNDVAQWTSGNAKVLVDSFRAAGDAVVLANLPAPQSCMFVNGGFQYRDKFIASINTIMNAVEAAHGPAGLNIAGGISFGGLHSMMASVISGRFAAWFAHLPVTRIDALQEFPSVGDVKAFNPQQEVSALKMTSGLVTWGTLDTRVNGTLIKAIADQLPDRVSKIEYVQGHETKTQNVADIAAWVNSLP